MSISSERDENCGTTANPCYQWVRTNRLETQETIVGREATEQPSRLGRFYILGHPEALEGVFESALDVLVLLLCLQCVSTVFGYLPRPLA